MAKPAPLSEEDIEAGIEPPPAATNKISLDDGSMVIWLDTRWNIGHPDNYEIREDGRKTYLVKKSDRDKKYEELNNWSLYYINAAPAAACPMPGSCRTATFSGGTPTPPGTRSTSLTMSLPKRWVRSPNGTQWSFKLLRSHGKGDNINGT